MNLKYGFCCIAALFSLSVSSISVLAQQNVETLQVTGTRLADYTAGSFSSLSREQIDAINPASTLDLLNRIPNIVIAENGVAGGVSFVSVRGGESNFTLVLIDGVAVNDSTNSRGGGFDFSQINPQSIERVEVYHGGISAIYGGEAISGVIHIITREQAAPAINFEVGSDKQVNGSLNLSHAYANGVSVLASLSSRQREASDFATANSQQGLFKVAFANTKQNHRLLVTYSDNENLSFAEDSGGELYAMPQVAEQRNSEQWLVGLNNTLQLEPSLAVNLNLSWLDRQESSDHPGIAEGVQSGVPASVIDSQFTRSEIELFVNHQLNQQTTIVVGVSARDAEGSNTGFLDYGFQLPVDFVLEQNSQSAFIEGKYAQNNYAIDLGLRYDDADNFDSETSVRFAGHYDLSDDVNVFAVYNEGYKLPSFFALAHPLVGNPELQPERSVNKELGVEWVFELGQITLVLFENDFTDLVDFDAELFTSVNRSSVETSGVELNSNIELTKWLQLSIDVSYVDITVDGQQSQLRRRPEWSGGASLDAQWHDVTISIFADVRDAYLDSSIPTGLVELGGYAKYGVSANWQLSDNLQTHLNIDNALAHDIQDSVGFENNDANFRVGMTYQF
ncbi:TonB-dependent receptor [Aliiglaciecola sp. 2_MG-2023]|uniref:TonB-dependent receptor plug domain-containing protein n=1 Tax=unclassified Aliiglaciecola TaxID=2593648 RepID=UPI0026E22041|nr:MULTISPECIES: TonB-dependent receptor [unclassified Aliiglaciecola]MDO6712918.1 TonB-dependent receptor [Aliiglaciecola sp. 2_MG-2023]MDO6753957.1 TonB-dependent receptor [Aliiglaciecola sp. 1_MG-2023]